MSAPNSADTDQRPAGRNARSTAAPSVWPTVAMVMLVLFALAATLIMVFTDSSAWMRVAVGIAVWAAVLGAFLIMYYQRRATQVASRNGLMAEDYQRQLERELNKYDEQESQLRQELEEASRRELEELRQELTALRISLAQMFGPEFEDQLAIGGGGEGYYQYGEYDYGQGYDGYGYGYGQDDYQDGSYDYEGEYGYVAEPTVADAVVVHEAQVVEEFTGTDSENSALFAREQAREREAAEAARQEELQRRAEEEREAEAKRQAEESWRAEEERRLKKQQREAEKAARAAEEERLAEEARQSKLAADAEAKREAEEARQAETARKAFYQERKQQTVPAAAPSRARGTDYVPRRVREDSTSAPRVVPPAAPAATSGGRRVAPTAPTQPATRKKDGWPDFSTSIATPAEPVIDWSDLTADPFSPAGRSTISTSQTSSEATPPTAPESRRSTHSGGRRESESTGSHTKGMSLAEIMKRLESET